MFVFGTQYLRGATPIRDEWMRDLENIKKAGFNTVRAWLVWNTIEKAECSYDYDYINSFLDCIAQNDLKVGLLFHMHASPEWATKKYPEYFYVDEDGIPFEPAARPNTPSGGWPGLCFDHAEVREIEKRFIVNIMKETSKRKEISFYEPMNEPHQWIDPRKKRGIFCYCPATREKFREWLLKKYGDIKTLNYAWGRYHNDFSEVRPPRWIAGYTDYVDFRLFTMDNIRDEIQYRTEIIKANDVRPVVAHSWGGGAVSCRMLGGMAFDDWKNAQVSDMWGYSAFPANQKDSVMLGLGTVATRNAAGDKVFWQSELGAGSVGRGLFRPRTIDENELASWTLESLRHGAKGILYWQYRKESQGSELAGFGLTYPDGGETPWLRRVSAICKTIQENEEIFSDSKPPKPEVAIVFSVRSYLADWCSHGSKSLCQLSVDSVSGYFRMLWEENIPVDIIHEDFVNSNEVDRYKVIILPMLCAPSQNLVDMLKKFTAGGGTIFSDPYFGIHDQNFHFSTIIPGHGFDKVFGCKEEEISMEKGAVKIIKDQIEYTVNNGHFLETFKDVSGEVLYRYQNGAAAIISNRYHKGRAIISGINLGLSYSPKVNIADDDHRSDGGNESLTPKNIVMSICTEQGVSRNPCRNDKVRFSCLFNDVNDDVAIIINSSQEIIETDCKLNKKYSNTKVLTGACEVVLNEQVLHIVLQAGASAIIRLFH